MAKSRAGWGLCAIARLQSCCLFRIEMGILTVGGPSISSFNETRLIIAPAAARLAIFTEVRQLIRSVNWRIRAATRPDTGYLEPADFDSRILR
jgi:hypothetical protein